MNSRQRNRNAKLIVIAYFVIAAMLACVFVFSAAQSQTVTITRSGASACQCRTETGTELSAHTSSPQAYESCIKKSFELAKPTLVTCADKITTTKPATPPQTTGTLIFNWTAPTQHTDGRPLTTLTGYRILYGTSPTELTTTVNVGNVLTHSVPALPLTTTYYATIQALAGTEISDPTAVASGRPR